MEDTAIKVENLSKTFKLPHEKNASVKSALINFRRRRTYELQHALRDVSFEIKKGEFFGIVGRNGSGKSTLLKLIAGIYAPTRGNIKINGSLTPFIELGVGFNPELTGRENVYLNGALLGFSRKEMNAMYKDIVEFAELEKFMDQKLKNYSSGMQVRLAFSIAIRAHSDILLIDEVLAVGDAAFQAKCMDYFADLKQKGKTVILVTHDMNSVRSMCTRAALITNGKMEMIGDPEYIAELYEKQNAAGIKLFTQTSKDHNSGVEISELLVKGSSSGEFDLGQAVTIKMTVISKKLVEIIPGLNITREDGKLVAGLTAIPQLKHITIKPGRPQQFTFSFNSDQLTGGTFLIDGVVYGDKDSNGIPLFFVPSAALFKTTGEDRGWGMLNLKGVWKEKK